jgi:hypothetical protein
MLFFVERTYQLIVQQLLDSAGHRSDVSIAFSVNGVAPPRNSANSNSSALTLSMAV